MASIFFCELLRHYTAVNQLDLEVSDYRELVQLLQSRFPGIEGAIEEQTMVAIDGDMIYEPLLESINNGSEVHFLPKISAG